MIYPQYKDRDWLKEQIEKKRSYKDIGLECNVAKITIGRWVKKLGIFNPRAFEPVDFVPENYMPPKLKEEVKEVQKQVSKMDKPDKITLDTLEEYIKVLATKDYNPAIAKIMLNFIETKAKIMETDRTITEEDIAKFRSELLDDE